jgi:hypothetical protein
MAFTTPSDSSLHTLSVSELAERCLSEVNTYRRGEPCDAQYCVELFRRAMMQRDTVARGVVEQCFHETMLGWLRSHPQTEVACRLESEEHYLTQAFARFWQAAARSEELACQDLATTLCYLRASLHDTLLDAMRAPSVSKRVPLPEPTEPGATHVQGHDEGQAGWEGIQRLLPDEREQQAAYLLFHCGLTPGEIIRCCPETFSDVQELARLRRSIMERLLGDGDSPDWQ